MYQNAELRDEWFRRRFEKEPEHDPMYYKEWVERFKYDDPTQYMDSESLDIWADLIAELATKLEEE